MLTAGSQTLELFGLGQLVPLQVARRRPQLFVDVRQLPLELLDRFYQFGFAFFPFGLCCLVEFRVQGEGGKASLLMGQLGFDRASPVVQLSPLGVDHRTLGLRNLLRAILVKQVDTKVFHHVAQEVFLGPSAKQPRSIRERRLAEGRADQADLVPTVG